MERHGRLIETDISDEAKRRQLANLKQFPSGSFDPLGATRVVVAEKVGLGSASIYYRGKKVLDDLARNRTGNNS